MLEIGADQLLRGKSEEDIITNVLVLATISKMSMVCGIDS
jgi:hypothetical protein